MKIINNFRTQLIIVLITSLLLSIITIPTIHADDSTHPIVLMKSYTIDETITSGNEFTLNYTLENTSTTTGVNNILITFSDPNNIFFPAFGTSNQTYIPLIDIASTTTASSTFNVRDVVNEGTYYLQYNLSYQTDIDDSTVTLNGAIALNIGEGSIEILDIILPEQCTVNEPAYTGILYKFIGEEENYNNLRIELTGSIIASGNTININNANSSSAFAEHHVTFLEAGTQVLTATIAYETEDGETIYSPTFDITTSVELPIQESTTNEVIPEVTEPTFIDYLNQNAIIIVFIVLAIISIIFLIYIKKTKQSNER